MDNNQEEPAKDDRPAFKPASNPFLSKLAAKTPTEAANNTPTTTSVEVGGKSTTLVGDRADSKQQPEATSAPSQTVEEEVLYQWQAPEFVYTEKPLGWFFGIFAFFSGLGVLAFFFINSTFQKWSTIGLLIIMAIAISVWARRKPKISNYVITNYGIEVENKKYSFDDFRAFYEFKDYNQPTIDLVPGKRFGALVSLPLATPEADEIKETIAHMVPKIEHTEDIADKIFRRLRF